MKESNYMFPLNDSFDQQDMCPFCFLETKTENDSLEYCMGPSMMEPDSRQISNKTGFCRQHLDRMLASANNRLSIALMLLTHVEFVKDAIEKTQTVKGGLFKKDRSDFSETIACSSDCIVCKKVSDELLRYIDTFYYMFKKTPGFAEKLENSKHLCVSHVLKLLANDKSGNENLKNALIKRITSTLENDIAELKAFTDMFDYRSKETNPSAHKNALPDAVAHLRSKIK